MTVRSKSTSAGGVALVKNIIESTYKNVLQNEIENILNNIKTLQIGFGI